MPVPKKVNRMAVLQKELEERQGKLKASTSTTSAGTGRCTTNWRELFKDATDDQKKWVEYIYGSWSAENETLMNRQKADFGAGLKKVVTGKFRPASGVMMSYFKPVPIKNFKQQTYRSVGNATIKPAREPQTVNWGVSDRSGLWAPAANQFNPSQSRAPSTWDPHFDTFSSNAEVKSLLQDPHAADPTSHVYMGSAFHHNAGNGGLNRTKLIQDQERAVRRERKKATKMREGEAS